MSVDGTTLDVGNTMTNARAFGRPASARGVNATGAFPQLRIVELLERGTHAICAAQLGGYAPGKSPLPLRGIRVRSRH